MFERQVFVDIEQYLVEEDYQVVTIPPGTRHSCGCSAEIVSISKNYSLVSHKSIVKHIRQQRTLFADIDRFAELSAVLRLLALGELRRLGEMLDVSRDDTGLMLDIDGLPQRIRRPKPLILGDGGPAGE